MALDVYSSRDVTVKWDNIDLVGLSPDSFITITRNADFTDEEVGADGQLQISRNPNRTATCQLSFQQNSPAHQILAKVMLTQETSKKFLTGTLVLGGKSGAGLFVTMTNAHVKSMPEITLGSTATGASRTWTFFVEELRMAPLEIDETTASAIGAVTGIFNNL